MKPGGGCWCAVEGTRCDNGVLSCGNILLCFEDVFVAWSLWSLTGITCPRLFLKISNSSIWNEAHSIYFLLILVHW